MAFQIFGKCHATIRSSDVDYHHSSCPKTQMANAFQKLVTGFLLCGFDWNIILDCTCWKLRIGMHFHVALPLLGYYNLVYFKQ